MIEVKATTAKGQQLIKEAMQPIRNRSIFDAYQKPSRAKVESFQKIEKRAKETPGYNNDLHVTGGSYNYSTIYTFTDNGKLYAVKDTQQNTYIILITE